LAIYKNTYPLNSVGVNVDTIAIHEVVGPVSFINGPICVLHFSLSLHYSIFPSSLVDISGCECVGTFAMHLIINPLAIIGFSSSLFTSSVIGTCEGYLSITILYLFAIFSKSPLALIQSLIYIFKCSCSILWNRWCCLFL
jgi:hypothetical protein